LQKYCYFCLLPSSSANFFASFSSKLSTACANNEVPSHAGSLLAFSTSSSMSSSVTLGQVDGVSLFKYFSISSVKSGLADNEKTRKGAMAAAAARGETNTHEPIVAIQLNIAHII